jgi:hypothetical protein
MLSILVFSGRHWMRAAAAWFLLAFAVDALADAGSEGADARLQAHNAAVALGVLTAVERLGKQGSYQVPKIEMVEFDLSAVSPETFGDGDDGSHRR